MATTQRVMGFESVGLRTNDVEAWVTLTGGQIGPVTFRFGDRNLQPFHVSPWHDEPLNDPPCIRALRGDFFCMPFGGHPAPFQGELHPIHGETANGNWQVVESTPLRTRMELWTSIRPGLVTKEIELREGHSAIYSRHTVSAMSGPMTFGHHAMLRFQSEGLVSLSPIGYGQVFPGQFENPVEGGYYALKQGARFDRVDAVPALDGSTADLSRYPAREGFEDCVIVYSELGSNLAWAAVTFPEERYVWFSLKDPRVLSGMVLWHSNGGRHYAPWNGRHRRVLGLEDVTATMLGMAGSIEENEASREGYMTHVVLDPEQPLVVSTVMAVAEIPEGFDHVASIEPNGAGVVLTSRSGKTIEALVELGWLYGPNPDPASP